MNRERLIELLETYERSREFSGDDAADLVDMARALIPPETVEECEKDMRALPQWEVYTDGKLNGAYYIGTAEFYFNEAEGLTKLKAAQSAWVHKRIEALRSET